VTTQTHASLDGPAVPIRVEPVRIPTPEPRPAETPSPAEPVKVPA
jgi:hypothetical protein